MNPLRLMSITGRVLLSLKGYDTLIYINLGLTSGTNECLLLPQEKKVKNP